MQNKNVPTLERPTDSHEGLIEVTDGVTLLRDADLSAIAATVPKYTRRDDGTDKPDMISAEDEKVLRAAVDTFVQENLDPRMFENMKLQMSWANVYAEGDVMYSHKDYPDPIKATTFIANISGSALLYFPETDVTIEVTEGDVILLDGLVNPEHEVMSVTDRVSIVGLYE